MDPYRDNPDYHKQRASHSRSSKPKRYSHSQKHQDRQRDKKVRISEENPSTIDLPYYLPSKRYSEKKYESDKYKFEKKNTFRLSDAIHNMKLRLFDNHFGNLEGPKSLRALSFCGGVASTSTSLFAVCNLHKLLTAPPLIILLFYQLFFGLTTMIIEAKNFHMFESIQPWMNQWFPFLSEPLGKGFLFILMGVLGMTLWQHFLFVAGAGGFMCFIGFLYLIVSCGGSKPLKHVGIELTQHPGHGGLSEIPQIGSHRYKNKTNLSNYNMDSTYGDYDFMDYNVDKDNFSLDDPTYKSSNTKQKYKDYTDTLQQSWLGAKDKELPYEFISGLNQYHQETALTYT